MHKKQKPMYWGTITGTREPEKDEAIMRYEMGGVLPPFTGAYRSM